MKKLFIVLLSALLFIPAGSGVSLAAPSAVKHQIEIIRVQSGAVTPTSVTGTGLGTVRTYFVPTAINAVAADGQYITGTLTTVVTGLPNDKEMRLANLVFVMGQPQDQIVLGGLATYPTGASVIAEGERTVRPIIGGSGKYAGVVGYAVSINKGPQGWTHVLHLKN